MEIKLIKDSRISTTLEAIFRKEESKEVGDILHSMPTATDYATWRNMDGSSKIDMNTWGGYAIYHLPRLAEITKEEFNILLDYHNEIAPERVGFVVPCGATGTRDLRKYSLSKETLDLEIKVYEIQHRTDKENGERIILDNGLSTVTLHRDGRVGVWEGDWDNGVEIALSKIADNTYQIIVPKLRYKQVEIIESFAKLYNIAAIHEKITEQDAAAVVF